MIGSYVLDEKDGLWGLFYENEQLQMEQMWKLGALMEVSPFYTSKGEELDAGTLTNGNGQLYMYYEDGTIQLNETYRNGRLNGKSMYYYEDGTLQVTGEYINNQRTGTWQEFSDRGRLIAEGMYKLDEKVGTWKYYNTRGKLVDTEEY